MGIGDLWKSQEGKSLVKLNLDSQGVIVNVSQKVRLTKDEKTSKAT